VLLVFTVIWPVLSALSGRKCSNKAF